eukprot:gene7311-13007_t
MDEQGFDVEHVELEVGVLGVQLEPWALVIDEVVVRVGLQLVREAQGRVVGRHLDLEVVVVQGVAEVAVVGIAGVLHVIDVGVVSLLQELVIGDVCVAFESITKYWEDNKNVCYDCVSTGASENLERRDRKFDDARCFVM